MEDMFKKPVKIRKAAQRGKEMTIPPGTSFEPVDDGTQFYDDNFVLIVTKGIKVDEELLRQAVMTE